MNPLKDWFRNKRVTVMGLGLFGGGLGLTRFLAKNHARITITDLRKPEELQESIQALASLPNIKYTLGKHRMADFGRSDLVVVNPAVPDNSPYLKYLLKHNIPIETEMGIFVKLCPCQIIAVTGTNGKTTTAALIAEFLSRCGGTDPKAFGIHPKGTGRRIWLGGNIGKLSLLELIDRIKPQDLVVLEISSFQLERLAIREPNAPPEFYSGRWRNDLSARYTGLITRFALTAQVPNLLVSVVTNIQPNHLDRHKTMANYINAKKNILRCQPMFSYAVLNGDDKELLKWQPHGARLLFSRKPSPDAITFIKDKQFCIRQGGKITNPRTPVRGGAPPRGLTTICPITETKLLGTFNQENILAALTVASIFNVRPIYLRQAIRRFTGVEHRLEFVARIKGVKYYNDSIATNPTSTIGALRAVPGVIHLIAGGYDKKLPFGEMAKEIVKRKVKSVIVLGQTADEIARQIRRYQTIPNLPQVIRAKDLRDAVALARHIARPGDTVLLSPACASFDMFRNFVERGNLFKKLVTSED